MKILEKQLKKGFVKVVPESLDDFWHLYNIIYAEDQVYAKTTRIMKIEELYARPKKGKRVSVILGIRVQKVFWDRSLNRLRVHGIICEAPEDIGGIGSHHTLDVVLNKPISVVKSQWQKHQLERLERASHVETPLITVLAIDDEEYCVAVLRQYGMEVKGEKKTRLPSKMEPEKREEAFKAFFKSALQILRESWMSLRNLIVVIGPGFVKSNFVKYVQSEAPDIAEAIVDVKSVNSAGVAGINEALRSGVLANTLKNVRIAEETQLVEEVLTRLGKGTGNVAYGLDEVVKAIQYGAVEKLLLTDTMLREAPNEKRISLENIMRDVENKGGQVIIVSTEYEAGAQLRGLTGIVALLRFSIS